MSQIDELQRRITVALDRIGQGFEGLQTGGSASGAEALRQELEEEKTANEQLQERVRALKETRDAAVSDFEKARADHAETVRRLDGELQSLRKANQQLRDNNLALREANASGVGEPHLINKAMLAELEGLRATHAADRAEAEVVLLELARAIDTASDGDSENAEPEEA